jgi:ribonuclease P protein component
LKKFGLSKIERIKSKKEFSLVYSAGTVIYSDDRKFKVNIYKIENIDSPSVKAGFAVHRKSGIAVWRNRVKRLLRESFRLNKKRLIDWSSEKKISVLLVFSPSSINQKNYRKIYLQDIMPQVVNIMDKIIKAG